MFPELFCLLRWFWGVFKVIAITITQNSRGKGEEEDSISVSNSCYHRGKGHQFQKMCLPTRMIFTCFGDLRWKIQSWWLQSLENLRHIFMFSWTGKCLECVYLSSVAITTPNILREEDFVFGDRISFDSLFLCQLLPKYSYNSTLPWRVSLK